MEMRRGMASATSGVLFGMGFLIPHAWPMVLIGIVPLLFALRHATLRAAATFGWLASFVLGLIALLPIFWATLPLDWYGFSSIWAQWFAVGVSWVITAAVLALGGAVFGAFVNSYATHSWRDMLVIPAAWVISEWLGSFVFSIIALGPGSLVGAHFTLTYIGYVLANDPVLLQLARLGDVYALSFGAVAVGSIVYRLIFTTSARERRALYILACAMFLIWIIAHPLVRYLEKVSRAAADDPVSSLTIAAISRYAPPLLEPTDQEERARFKALRGIVARLRGIDALVFPENAVFLRSISGSERNAVAQEFEKIGVGGKAPLSIDSEDIMEDTGLLYSRLAYTGGDAETVYSYKQFLLPLGEYMPYVYRVALRIFGGGALLEDVVRVRGYAKGPFVRLASVRGIELAARFCDEVMSPQLYQQDVVRGARILVNLSSQSWFHGSRLVYEEMKQVARVRAVAYGRWYVQSGNMAPAYILDEYGQIIGETDWNEADALTARVPALDTTTPAAWIGEFFLLVPFGLALICIWDDRRERTSIGRTKRVY